MKRLHLLLIILIAMTSLSCVCASDNTNNNTTVCEPQINQEINNNDVSNLPTNDLQINDENNIDSVNHADENPVNIKFRITDFTHGKVIVKFDWKLNTELESANFILSVENHSETASITETYDFIKNIDINPTENSGSFVEAFDIDRKYLVTVHYREPGSNCDHETYLIFLDLVDID